MDWKDRPFQTRWNQESNKGKNKKYERNETQRTVGNDSNDLLCSGLVVDDKSLKILSGTELKLGLSSVLSLCASLDYNS